MLLAAMGNDGCKRSPQLVTGTSEPAQENAESSDGEQAQPEREPDPLFRLDPMRLPKRLDLTLDTDLADRLEQLAARSGRSFDEVVVDLLNRVSPQK